MHLFANPVSSWYWFHLLSPWLENIPWYVDNFVVGLFWLHQNSESFKAIIAYSDSYLEQGSVIFNPQGLGTLQTGQLINFSSIR